MIDIVEHDVSGPPEHDRAHVGIAAIMATSAAASGAKTTE